jgi:hypothetical protein
MSARLPVCAEPACPHLLLLSAYCLSAAHTENNNMGETLREIFAFHANALHRRFRSEPDDLTTGRTSHRALFLLYHKIIFYSSNFVHFICFYRFLRFQLEKRKTQSMIDKIFTSFWRKKRW